MVQLAISDGENTYCNAKQYMMAEKARLFGDKSIEAKIMSSRDPSVIKKLGQQVKNFNEQVWNAHKFNIVNEGNLLKFSSSPVLKAKLLNTNDAVLAEASPYDRVWVLAFQKKTLNQEPRGEGRIFWEKR